MPKGVKQYYICGNAKYVSEKLATDCDGFYDAKDFFCYGVDDYYVQHITFLSENRLLVSMKRRNFWRKCREIFFETSPAISKF